MGPSLLTIFRSKQDGRRSRSSPPTNRTIDWSNLPTEYRPTGPLGVRTIQIQARTPLIPQPKPEVSQSMRQEVTKMNRKASVLLQLPPPRAMWRRSLEDLSPTKRREWLNPEDLRRKQVLAQIACAMPPDFFDHPPDYTSDLDEGVSPLTDDDIRRSQQPSSYQAGSHNITDFESFRQQIERMPTFTPNDDERPRRFTETEYQIMSALQQDPSSVTMDYIDTLLMHPMLKTSS